MKMRVLNHLLAAVCVVVNIFAMVAVLTGNHTVFGVIAVSLSMVVSLGVYLRMLIGTAALQMADKEAKLVRFAIAQQKDPSVVRQFAEWVKSGDLDFNGAQITDLCKAIDENGKCEGFWLLMIGTQNTYESIRRKLSQTATILDYWPIDPEKWCQNLLDTLEQDEDFDEADAVPELKG